MYHTRNNNLSVKLPKVRTELGPWFGRKQWRRQAPIFFCGGGGAIKGQTNFWGGAIKRQTNFLWGGGQLEANQFSFEGA